MTAAPAPEVVDVSARRKHWLRQLLGRPTAIIAVAFLLVVVVAAIAAPLVSPFDPLKQDFTNLLSGPSPQHWLGTDTLGRDILSRMIYGARVTLLGVLVAVVVYTAIGILFGIIAGSAGGIVDTIIMRVCDLMQSIPGLIILLVVLAVFGQNELAAMLTLGVIISQGLVRVVRGVTLSVRETLYVAAGRVAGLGPVQIQVRHVLPAVYGPALTQITLFSALALIVEASLGYLGLGAPAPTPSWGNLISDAQTIIARDPWMLVPTGGIVVLTALALGVLGNALRDAYAGRLTSTGREFSWRSLTAAVRRVAGTSAGTASSPVSESALLEVAGLSVALPGPNGAVTVVEDVSLAVRAGESLGIVGESGCGKSITVAGIMRVLPAGASVSAERVRFDGRDLLALSERQMASGVRGSGIAFISQEPISSLDPVFTVGTQLAEAVRHHQRVSRREARVRALELLRQVRLPDSESVAARYPHQLSGGMAQRVAIARALAGRPKLLIADEPSTALDVTVQAGILDLLHDLRRDTGMALILVTHDWGVLADSCDRTVVMYAGQVVESSGIRDVIRRPAHPYTLALVASNPADVEVGERLPSIAGVVPPPGRWPSGCRFAARCAFATDACRTQPIPLEDAGAGQESRCIRVDAVRAEEAA
jgi:peptide/nickel transport system permease protein